jgi:HEAT repeat protein
VGNTTCLTTLVEVAQEKDEELVAAAKKALAELPGEDVNKEIIARLAKPDPKVYTALIEVVGLRLIEATPALQKALENSDKSVRAAALTSLGATVPPDKLSILIKQVVSPKSPEDEPIAQTALKTACVRMADREACAAELDAALDKASVPTKIVILKILGAVGGSKAVQTIGTVAKSSDLQLQDASTDLLGKWMTADAAPYLLDLAKSSTGYQDRTMKGYIRIVKFAATPEERVEMCLQAFEACRQVSQQKLVLALLKQNPSIPTLKLAMMRSSPL